MRHTLNKAYPLGLGEIIKGYKDKGVRGLFFCVCFSVIVYCVSALVY